MGIKWPTKYNKATNRRKQWEDLKKKHALALKNGKVDFSSDFGAAIDKFESEIKKVADPAFAAKATLDDLEKVSQTGAKAQSIAESYKPKVAKLTEPAKKELTTFLNDVSVDAQLWQDNTLFEPELKGKWHTPEWGVADKFGEHVSTLVRHGNAGLSTFNYTDKVLLGDPQRLLRPLGIAVIEAAKPVEPSAIKISALYQSALKNISYLDLLKAETTKAVAAMAPFMRAGDAYRKYAMDKTNIHRANAVKATPPDFQAMAANIPILGGDVVNLTKAIGK